MSTININVSRADMGLDQVDNTSDLNKPISTATQTALDNIDLQSVTDIGNTTTDNIAFTGAVGVLFDNTSTLRKGTIDAGYGGAKGIAQICSVGYELKWEAGRLYVMGDGGTTIREVSHNFTTTPSATDDNTKGFIVGSRWILDDGSLYICTDVTTATAVWVLQTIDSVPTDGSTKPVSSNGVFDALDLKVDKVTGSRLITSAEATLLSNTSGTNTGDQDLQSVTDEGSTTSNNISIEDTVFRTFLAPNSVQISPKTLATYSVLDADGKLQLKTNATSYGVLKATNVTAETTLEFPNKTAGSYTIATTSDFSGYQATLTATNLKTLVDTFTVTTTPIDADVVPITDSAGTTTKKLSWSNFKTSLLAYFDGIFGRITATTTGTSVSFSAPIEYGTFTLPESGNITNDLTGAKVGYLQKIYHNKATEPTYPAAWVRISGTYVPSSLNVILANYCSPTRVEYSYITDTSTLLVKGSNLSDLTNTTTARTNLGLGSLSTQSGTFSGTSSGTNTGDQTISDATITTTDITTNNFTTSKHGFVPKGTNVGNYLKDDGTWSTISAGGLTYFTEAQSTASPNATVNVDSLTAIATSTNADFVIKPKGTGSILASIPDDTTTGGTKRGLQCTDLQTKRTASTQVATGNYGVIGGGYGNQITSGESGTIAGGYVCVITGAYGTASGLANSIGNGGFGAGISNTVTGTTNSALGNSNTITGGSSGFAAGDTISITSANFSAATGRNHTISAYDTFSAGYLHTNNGQGSAIFGARGSANSTMTRLIIATKGFVAGGCQASRFVSGARTTSAVAKILVAFFEDDATSQSYNQLVLANNSSVRFKGTIIGRQSGSTNTSAWDIDGIIQRGTTAGSTTLLISNVNVVQNTPAWGTPTLAANTTIGCLTVNVTGAATTNIQWTCSLDTTEVIYA